jgi:ribosomal protein S18 acetylase RimI-like enzyme
MNENYSWRKLKKKDIPLVESLLRGIENDYVSACGRFLEPSGGQIWKLENKKGICALLINSRSTLIPVLCGIKEIPRLKFLKGFLREKNIHSIQGLKEDVLVIENEMEKTGRIIADKFEYDLMSLDSLPFGNEKKQGLEKLVLRTPQLIDLDAVCPLQEGYEKEEVLPRGSAFSPAASRVNIAKIISDGKILAAQINGRLVGKINVSAVSFTRYLVGGVYVHPDFRGLGIARRMAGEFISSLINEGRGVTLFVKKNNIPARRLYLSLGFKKRGDYLITYY